MNRTQMIAKLAELPNTHWMSACARCRWLYKRYGVEPFDLSDMHPVLVDFLAKEPPETAWTSLRLAVTRKRRAATVRAKRHEERDRAVNKRAYNRHYMAEYRAKKKEKAHPG